MGDQTRNPGLEVLLLIDGSRERAETLKERHGLSFPIGYEAETTRRAYGVESIWGSTFILISPDGRILADGLDDCERAFRERSGSGG